MIETLILHFSRKDIDLKIKKLRIPIFNFSTLPNYSTVSFVRCKGERFIADCFFHFAIFQRTPLLQQPSYSDYQYFIYETISELRNKYMTFNQIADELNRKGYLSARGRVFKGTCVLDSEEEKNKR